MSDTNSNGDPSLPDENKAGNREGVEVERLRRRLADERFAEELREALILASAAGTIASPVTYSRLLEMIVETAANVISAKAAALFLIDQETQELMFEIALGQKASEVKKFRLPLGHGIAGLVAVTGQPMAVSDAQKDSRQAADIAQSVGYVPQNIVCVPLFFNDQIIGVLELLDKEGAPAFDENDIHILGLFANQAAVAIEQSRTHRNLAGLILEVLQSFGGMDEHRREGLHRGAILFGQHTEADPAYQQALELARMVQELTWAGPAEAKLCHSILTNFLEYLRARPMTMAELGAM
jgi:GAF domain-containing protein